MAKANLKNLERFSSRDTKSQRRMVSLDGNVPYVSGQKLVQNLIYYNSMFQTLLKF